MTNVRTARGDHEQYCEQPSGGHLGKMNRKVMVAGIGMTDAYLFNRAGDVRRCVHGRVMIGYDVPGLGNGCYWRDLSPFWNPILYRRAVKALKESDNG